MYSMNYIGKFIENFRYFYNEINAATLTGAIDVVVVEQPDGSFTCSPFHVRFGKLGVLRSRLKVVDLELNGEPLDIHMKLGESGEAFFVEEVGEDEEACLAHLATSPIPASHFAEIYEPRRRNSLSAVEPDHGQASDYTKRRYTADGKSMQKPDLSKLKKHKSEQASSNNPDSEALFEMEGLDEPCSEEIRLPKTFSATQIDGLDFKAVGTFQKINAQNEFRPIGSVASYLDDTKQNGNGKKKKKRKSSTKKKHQRKSSNSSVSSQSDRQSVSVPNTTELNFLSDSEITAATLREEMSNLKLTGETRIPLALSDTAFEVQAASRNAASRRGTPVQSDTEVELARTSTGEKSSQSWRWGELPEPPVRIHDALVSPPSPASPAEPASPSEPLSSDEERPGRSGVLSGMFKFMSAREANAAAAADGVYLDDLDRGRVDLDLYFPKHNNERYRSETNPVLVPTGPTEEEYESGNGPSLPQSPASLEPQAIDSDEDEKLLAKGDIGIFVHENSASRKLSWEEWCAHGPRYTAEGRIVVRFGRRWMPWRRAAPLLLSLLAYRNNPPDCVLDDFEKVQDKDLSISDTETSRTADSAKPRTYSWWSWRRTNPDAKRNEITSPKEDATKDFTLTQSELSNLKTLNNLQTKEEAIDEAKTKEESIGEAITKEVTISEPKTIEEAIDDAKIIERTIHEAKTMEETIDEAKTREENTTEKSDVKDNNVIDGLEPHVNQNEQILKNITEPTTDNGALEQSSPDSDSEDRRRPKRRHSTFRKTLRLSSEQIEKLNLRQGMNEMVFSVTTAYQGTSKCKCNVFRWRYDDKIVISDIDGTITKSDVLGHIFPLVGKDWAQAGVAQLFTKIKNNGYQLLYLSARAIGQAKVTREYLRSIKQGETSLPDGPLLLNPTSLLRALHREVIEKKPEEFKIQCLADIKALFPQGSNPFYAGYGNRVNDVCAYETVGIPIVRIFTINYKGELKHELTQTFQSTYLHMSVMVDQVFPPCLGEPYAGYSETVYWRDALPELDIVNLDAKASG